MIDEAGINVINLAMFIGCFISLMFMIYFFNRPPKKKPKAKRLCGRHAYRTLEPGKCAVIVPSLLCDICIKKGKK